MLNNSRVNLSQYPITLKFVHLAILLVAGVAIYSNTLENGFVWDDAIMFLGKDYYKSFDLLRILYQWGNGVEYLPLRDISYIGDYAIWGTNPFGFHLTNVFIFILSAFIIYFFTIKLIVFLGAKNQTPTNSALSSHLAFFVSLLFIVHPIQSQAVSFIACRNVLLSGLFFFLSLYLFLRYIENSDQRFHLKYYLLSLLFFQFALLSKATVIILPLVLLLLIYFSRRVKKIGLLFSLIPFVAMSTFFYFLFNKVATQTKVIREDLYEFGIYNIWINIAKAIQIPFFYADKMLLPKGLAAEYDIVFIKSIFHPIVLIAALIVVSLVLLAWRYRKSYPLFLFGLLWFIVTLLPVMNFLPTQPVVADRYVYLPAFGFFIIIVFACSIVFTNSKSPKLIMIVGCVVLLFLGFIAREQNTIWESDMTLWKDTVSKSPHLTKAYLNLGLVYLKMHDTANAYSLFKTAQRIDPSRPDYEDVRGYFALKKNDYSAAAQWFEAALKRKPGHLYALYHLGIVYEKSGNYEKAVECFNKIPDSPEYDLNGYRSSASLRVNLFLFPKFGPEIQQLRRVIEKHTADDAARVRLADALFKYGQYDDALSQYLTLEESGVRSSSLFYHLGEIYRRKERLREAINMYAKSLSFQQANCEALNSLGLVFKKTKKFQSAIKTFKRAIETDARCTDAGFNLAVSYFQIGDRENAYKYFEQVKQSDSQMQYNIEPYLIKMAE